jgi:Cupin-like domain
MQARNLAFPSAALSTLESAYPHKAAKLTHNLAGHPLMELEALVNLATAIPAENVEYNPGNLPIGIAPSDIPVSQLNIAETIRGIEENGSWMVLKRIEQHPAYAQLLRETLAEIEPLAVQRTGPMQGIEGFVFISSPGSVTPFHFDPEHNILLQMRGQKTMTVFSANDEELVSPLAHEEFHLGKHHRNQQWQDEFSRKGEAISIVSGEAIHVPVKAPHWVKNGPEVSVSLSITWRSDWSYAEADARAFNHVLRQIGFHPKSPAAYPSRNFAKSIAYRIVRRSSAALGRLSMAERSNY